MQLHATSESQGLLVSIDLFLCYRHWYWNVQGLRSFWSLQHYSVEKGSGGPKDCLVDEGFYV